MKWMEDLSEYKSSLDSHNWKAIEDKNDIGIYELYFDDKFGFKLNNGSGKDHYCLKCKLFAMSDIHSKSYFIADGQLDCLGLTCNEIIIMGIL
jgi:hypothetical protein